MSSKELRVCDVYDEKKLKIDTKEDAAELVKAIEECEGLETLNLSGKSFGVEASEAIGEALRHKPTLKHAQWSDMFVSKLKTEIPKSLEALGRGVMQSGARLVELDLSDNAFGPNGLVGVVELLKSSACFGLKIIRFNNNGLGIGGGKMLSKALLETHREAESAGLWFAPEVFVAGRNRLENEGASALAEVLSTVGSFKRIQMPQNSIFHKGVAALAQAVLANPQLEYLDLSDNIFTEVGSSVMAEAVGQLKRLKVVQFGDCLVRTEGAKSLAAALDAGHEFLEELVLSHNEIRVEGALAVLNTVVRKPGLKKLDLDGNCFGEDGCQQIQDFVNSNGLSEVLESLDEDEGSEEEEESEEEDGKGEGKEDAQVGDNEEGELVKDEQLQVKGQKIDTSRAVRLAEEELEDCYAAVNVARVYAKMAACYTGLSADERCKLEERVDVVLRKMVEQDEFAMSAFINELLVLVGLIKSEDKKFIPVEEKEGPLMMLGYIANQPYFGRMQRNTVIAFLSKPSKRLEALGTVSGRLLRVMHTL